MNDLLYIVFNKVYECNSITEASKILHISQPAVSRYIKELQNHYQSVLFTKNGRRIAPTSKAIALYSYTSQIELLTNEVEHYMNESDVIHTLHLGAITSISEILLPNIMSDLRHAYPDMKMYISVNNVQALSSLLLDRQLDIVLSDVNIKHPHITSKELFLTDLTLFSSVDSKYPNQMTLKELSTCPLFLNDLSNETRLLVDNAFINHQLSPNIICESNSNPFILSCVKRDLGLGIFSKCLLSEHLHNNEVREILISDYPLRKSFYISYPKNLEYSLSIREMISKMMHAFIDHASLLNI